MVTKKVVKKTKPTVEEMILNNSKEEVLVKEVYDVFNPNVAYKVTNLQLGNGATYMAGNMVAQFFGTYNQDAKSELEAGAKVVTITEKNSKGETVELYKIEVI